MAKTSVSKTTLKRGIVLDPDEPIWDVRQLDALIDLWLKDCYARLPRRTVDGYGHQIDYFRRWLADNGPALGWELRKADMQRFVTHMEAAGVAYNTRKCAVTRLRSMLRWAWETGRTEGVDYRFWVARPAGSLPVRLAAPILDLVKLLDATDRALYPVRDRAILAVLLGAGLRRAEASALNVEDVTIHAGDSGTLVVREAKTVEGRENQWRVVAFDAPTCRHIRAWLDDCDRTSGPLFVTVRGKRRLSDEGVYKVVKQLIALAGLSDKLQGPHDLRRNFATYFARQRRGEVHGQALSRQLGHSSFSMSSHYNLMDAEDLREVIASPFALMSGGER